LEVNFGRKLELQLVVAERLNLKWNEGCYGQSEKLKWYILEGEK